MDEPTAKIRLYGVASDSIVDGPGLRYSIFTQGCPHGCAGCHNPESQAFEGGYLKEIDELVKDITANKLIQGVTLSGGEPLAQAEACFVLAQKLKAKELDLWLYSGYHYEEILRGDQGTFARDLLALCDVLVDGPFVASLHQHDLLWKGSTNQRVIDISKSFEAGEVMLWERHESFPEAPLSW